MDWVSDRVDDLSSLGDDQEEKLSNMPDSLQESDSGQLLQERYDCCQSVSEQLQDIDWDMEEGTDPNKFIVDKCDEISTILMELA